MQLMVVDHFILVEIYHHLFLLSAVVHLGYFQFFGYYEKCCCHHPYTNLWIQMCLPVCWIHTERLNYYVTGYANRQIYLLFLDIPNSFRKPVLSIYSSTIVSEFSLFDMLSELGIVSFFFILTIPVEACRITLWYLFASYIITLCHVCSRNLSTFFLLGCLPFSYLFMDILNRSLGCEYVIGYLSQLQSATEWLAFSLFERCL